MSYTTLSVNQFGNLEINLTPEGLQHLKELEEREFIDEDILVELLEYYLCNGYSTVRPETIGALTDSLILADSFIDDETTQKELDETTIWWFPNYMIESYTQKLKEGQTLIFTKA